MTTATKTSSLNERAMLVKVTCHQWSASSTNQRVSKEACIQNGAKSDAGVFVTKLTPKGALDEINSERLKCRAIWLRYTLPWMDGGYRVIPSALFFEYTKKMRAAIAKHTKAVERFLERYPEYLQEAQERLGNIKKEHRLPSVEEIKYKFGIDCDVLPMPFDGDFRIDMNADDLDEIKANARNTIEAAASKAVTELYKQFGQLITNIIKSMKKDKRIHASVIHNLKDFCDMIPVMNITDDPKLEELRKEAMKKLSTLDPEDLRAIKSKRQAAGKDASELLDKIKQYS